MTSISAASISNFQSPLQRLQDQLQSEVNSGAISSSDQDALSSALTDIDSSIQASRASDEASGTRPSPGDIKSKIDDLISGEVSSGKLTSDQATELQGIFKSAFAHGHGGDLTEYLPRLEQEQFYSIEYPDGRPRSRYPIGTSLLAMPAVVVSSWLFPHFAEDMRANNPVGTEHCIASVIGAAAGVIFFWVILSTIFSS